VPDERLNVCQARQVAAFAAEVAAPDGVLVVGGDLNAEPADPTLGVLRDAGLADTHEAAGNAECDPATGAGCTSGRADDRLDDLTDPTSRQSVRIDYLLLGGRRACTAIAPTGLFNAEPAAAAPGAVVFPSDHTAVEATIECDTTADQRRSATTATVATTTTTERVAVTDPATAAAVSEAFEALFSGAVTDIDRKLAALEDAELLREHFLATYAAQQALADRVRVRVDAVALVDQDHAEVTYTLLLDGSAVLDHVAGGAVRRDGRWLVTRRTYCDVSTQGAIEIPPVCR
jgi:hypothetical protein